MISTITIDQLLSPNGKNNVGQSTNKNNNIRKPRVITKFTKPPRMHISTKENMSEQESTTATLTETYNSRREPSVYSNGPIFMDPPNASQTERTDCIQTRLAKLESSFPAKMSLLKEHNNNNNENPPKDNLTPANKRLALLLKKMREKKESSKASQSVQEGQQNNNGPEKESESFVNNKAASTDFIPLVDHNSQNTSNDWSLSPKIWPKDQIQPTDTRYSASPQTAQSNAEPSNQFSPYNQTDPTQHSSATMETMSQSDDKANKDGKTPAQGRLAQLLQKLRNSSSVKSYLASTTPPKPSVSSSSNTDCNNFGKKTGSRVCYNCGSAEHSFPVCPEPQRRFCHKCGFDNVTVKNCPRCQNRQKDA